MAPCGGPQPSRGGVSSFLSSLVKLSVKSCQVFRLFCQVFPNISFAVLGNINGLRGKNLLFDTISIFRRWLSRSSPQGCGFSGFWVAVKTKTPIRRGRDRPENSIACHTAFGNIFGRAFFGEAPGTSAAPAPAAARQRKRRRPSRRRRPRKPGGAGAPNLRFHRLAPCAPRGP